MKQLLLIALIALTAANALPFGATIDPECEELEAEEAAEPAFVEPDVQWLDQSDSSLLDEDCEEENEFEVAPAEVMEPEYNFGGQTGMAGQNDLFNMEEEECEEEDMSDYGMAQTMEDEMMDVVPDYAEENNLEDEIECEDEDSMEAVEVADYDSYRSDNDYQILEEAEFALAEDDAVKILGEDKVEDIEECDDEY